MSSYVIYPAYNSEKYIHHADIENTKINTIVNTTYHLMDQTLQLYV